MSKIRTDIEIMLAMIALSAFLITLGGCTSTATSQLTESSCKECLAKTPFYRNGVFLEEHHD